MYSTYLGGSLDDWSLAIDVDGSGSAYLTGYTASTDFPTNNPLQTSISGNQDAFVTKLSATGNALVYSTYLGGGGGDGGWGIAVDGSGSAYVTGRTGSLDFPILNPFQMARAGLDDAFVTKLSASGATLVYSTYLGGGSGDEGWGIAIDGNGSAYVTGGTVSTDFPTANPLQPLNAGNNDAFVTKLSVTGGALMYSTYLGGSGDEKGYMIAVEGSGNAFVTGYTYSGDFPTENPFQGTNAGNSDVFVTKLSASGAALAYSTFLGGSGEERGYGIAVDGSGGAYVTGGTVSTNFPTVSPLQGATAGLSDAFVTKLSASGASLVYSTYLGGSNNEGAGYERNFGIAVDGSGSAYVTGFTSSIDFPTSNPWQVANAGQQDVFIAKLGACSCPCHADPKCDGQTDVLDVVGVINVAFRGVAEQDDTECPKAREDVDCNGFVNVLDVVHMVNVAFRAGDPLTEFCVACP